MQAFSSPSSFCGVCLVSTALCVNVIAAAEATGGEAAIPFPAALSDAAIEVERLCDRMDEALLLGNGDITVHLWEEEGALALTLTKNDVWDARLDTTNEPPLPTLERIKELGRSGKPISETILPKGVTYSGRDSYYSHSYPCPRVCARIRLSSMPGKPFWRPVRLDGELIDWQSRGDARVMSVEANIQRAKGASAGYAYGPLDLATNDYQNVRIKLSGTPNARYALKVMGPDRTTLFDSQWIKSPAEPAERRFALPAGIPSGGHAEHALPNGRATGLILYTRTDDGNKAENRFEAVTFEGKGGSFAIELGTAVGPTTSARLDVRRAVAQISGAPGGPPRAAVRTLAQSNVVLIESPASAQLLPIESADMPAVERGHRDGVEWLLQRIPGDPDWPGMRFAVALASSGPYQAVAVVTSFEADDVVEEAIARARCTVQADTVQADTVQADTVQADTAETIRQHDLSWHRFWARSGLTIDDKLLQRVWYRSLYFLRCASKPGTVCPGLFFGLLSNAPPWHSDYHPNLNLQKVFYGAYSSNHAELAEPYDRLIREYLPRAKWLAGKVFGMEGAYFPHVMFAYEPPDPEKCKSPGGRQYLHHVWGTTLGVAGFAVQPLWLHYKYAPDRRRLEETVYPPLREVARFYAQFIEQCEETGDRVILAPSVSPEHWGWTAGFERNRNCTFDIAMVRYTLEAAIEAARILQRDEDLIVQLRRALDRLPPYPLHGTEEPVVVDVQDAPPIAYNIIVPTTPVFPGDAVTWQSAASERELFTRTIESIQHNGNCSTVWLGLARARLSLPGAQGWLHDEIRQRVRPNGTLSVNRLHVHRFDQLGFWTEQFGVGITVSELLVQSVGDVIRIFPALAPGNEAKVRSLRTQGGFLVSATARGGATETLSIESTVGGTLRLPSPWPGLEVRRSTAAGYETVALDENAIASLSTEAGEVLDFRARRRR